MNSKQSEQSPGDPAKVKWNVEQYVLLFEDDCLSPEALSRDFVDLLAQSGQSELAPELVTLLPEEVISLVKSFLIELRGRDYNRTLPRGLGCQLSEEELADYEKRLRPDYQAIDERINSQVDPE